MEFALFEICDRKDAKLLSTLLFWKDNYNTRRLHLKDNEEH